MSVNRELNLLKQPFTSKAVRMDKDRVVYFRGNTIICVNLSTGESESRDLISVHTRIKAIACHPEFGKKGANVFAVAIDSGKIYHYDFEEDLLTLAHAEHKPKADSHWMLHMTAEGGIVSITGTTLVHYCSVSKKAKSTQLLPKTKFNATEMSVCPWDRNLLAIGSYCGLVVVVSIKDRVVKYSFRGHNYQVSSLVWMRNLKSNQSGIDEDDDCFDVYDDSNFRGEFGVEKKVQPNQSFADYPGEPVESPPSNTNFDFAEACQTLKEEMLVKKQEEAMGTPQRPTQPDREECKQRSVDNEGNNSMSEGFSNESNASSELENMFEKIEIADAVDDLTLITLDQNMNVWVWDVQMNCGKGNFRIPSSAKRNVKQTHYHAQMVLLGDGRTMVGNTCNGVYFSLNLFFDDQKNKLEWDYKVKENVCVVLAATEKQKFIAFYPHHAIRVMEYVSPREEKLVREFPVYNSMGRAIAVSDVNPMRVAIATHEILFFDLTTVKDSTCSFTTYYKNIKSTIVQLAWHPEIEILAFGTLEGRIGLYNSQNHSVDFLKPFTGNEIYDLSFGKVGNEWQLFATCSNGICVSYWNKYSEFKFILQSIKGVSSLHVANTIDKLFIGTKQGDIYHVNPNELNSTAMHPIKVSKNYIRSFHVNCDQSQMAIVSKNSDIAIISMNQFVESVKSPQIIRLKGHLQPVIHVDWSRQNKNLLLSTSYDSTLRLWDISKAEEKRNAEGGQEESTAAPTACFEFAVKLKYAIFSPLNEDCIIVGTYATPFYVFNATKKTNGFPPKIVNLKPGAAKEEQIAKDTAKPKADKMEGATPAYVASSSSNAAKATNELKVVSLKKNETTIFYLAKRESTKKVMQCLQSLVNGGGGAAEEDANAEGNFLHKKLFSNDLDQIKEFLSEEVKNYKASDMKSRGCELVALMAGNVKETIVEHIKDKSLTETMVGIAPMVSHNFWKLCAEAFVMQLIEDDFPLKAVIYLLATHNVEDSLKLLTEKHYYREAWVLAKMKKAPEDPIFNELAQKWIEHLDICGDYEVAAVVAAGIGDYQRALEELMKRRDELLSDDHQAVIKALKAKSEEKK